MKRNYRNHGADAWYLNLCDDLGKLPFYFTYDSHKYCGFSSEYFTEKSCEIEKDGDKEIRTVVYTFADTQEATLKLTHYFSHGATEWTVWFTNRGAENSGVYEDIHIELKFLGKYPTLKGILGDHVNYYRPYCQSLTGQNAEFASDIGRSTHINFPYFNLEYGDGGVMLAIGWAGTWRARFSSDGEITTYTASSVNNLKTYLKPDESIRTALFASAPYTVRDESFATNYWRDWYVKYNLPKANSEGEELKPFSTACLAFDTGLPNSDGSISERYTTWRPSLEKIIAEDVKMDFRWFDAGWYMRPNGESEEVDWWGSVGTWELDPVKWPDGTFRESTDFAREHGMKTLVWFEPERVTDPENLAKNFGYNTDWAILMDDSGQISNNIGDPDCRKWTTERICKMLRENRVEMYREDNNINAVALWKHLDSVEGENRLGITECKLINAHYTMWDDIIACTLSHGGCGFVDSCASGGGRNDLESMRRGVPLLRSDHDRQQISIRLSMTTAFNRWIPFCGASTQEKIRELDLIGVMDSYVWRASYLPSLNIIGQFAQEAGQDFDMLRFGLKEWKAVSPYLLKEFYVLTPWHSEYDKFDFTSYCFFDPETEDGYLFAFRQEECVRDTLTVKLPFAEGEFRLTDVDSGEVIDGVDSADIFFESTREARLFRVTLEI